MTAFATDSPPYALACALTAFAFAFTAFARNMVLAFGFGFSLSNGFGSGFEHGPFAGHSWVGLGRGLVRAGGQTGNDLGWRSVCADGKSCRSELA